MFKVGDEVAYGVHGRCEITSIETKTIGANEVDFYLIRAIRPAAASKQTSKAQPQILVPVRNAASSGLRGLMTSEHAEAALKILSDTEYYFPLVENWTAKQRSFEETLRKEGALGLAKVVGHLYVVIKQDAVPRGEVVRFFEGLYRTLLNELSAALAKPTKDMELVVLKALKTKLHASH